GELHVWTDVEEYFLESLDFARATSLFAEPVSLETRPAEHDLDYHTHFERRTRLAGAPVWRALLARNDRPASVTRLP
ncbi:tRNA (guanine-N7)-methyltransferase, partial [bacterium]|nr:tRNA (guanine-N7)-methyltransferase [bacterium]